MKPQYVFGASGSPELVITNGTIERKIGLTPDGMLSMNDMPVVPNDVSGFEEYTYNSFGSVANHTIYTNNTKTQKIRETNYTYNSKRKLVSVITKLYNANGVLVTTQTETLTYDSSGRLKTVERVIT